MRGLHFSSLRSSLCEFRVVGKPWLPYSADIPGTDMTLYYKYTSWFTYQSKIKPLLTSSRSIIAHQISEHNADTKLIMDSSGTQTFRNSLHNGVDIEVNNLKPYAISWGDMRDLIKGLEWRCNLQLCTFEFSTGSGTKIGGGKIYKT